MKALLLCLLAFGLRAETIEFPESDAKAMRMPAQNLAKALAASRPMHLEAGSTVPRKAGGIWNAASLQQVLAGMNAFGSAEPEGSWVRRNNPVRMLLIENKSTVHPMSKQIPAWGWPFQLVEFEQIEMAPRVWLDPQAWDVVVFSSPGWWDNFSNPPSGPSRLRDSVAESVRAYVKGGGSAVFIDLAQWDLEACWPKSIRLSSLGPWRLDNFTAPGALEGKLALAPEGVVADRIFPKSRAVLFEQPSFPYTDGSIAQAFAAYAFPDPGGGSGLVAGFAFHVFDQDDSFAHRARRVLLNLLFVSGASRITAYGDVSAPANVATEVPLPSPTSTPEATAMPTVEATQAPSDTFSPTPSHSPVPPTQAPSPVPATALPTATTVPTAVILPTPVPTPLPTAVPTARPTAVPTQVPMPGPTPLPTRRPSALPTRQPSSVPTLAAPVLLPPTPLPLARKTEATQPTAVPPKVRDAIGCLQSAPEPFSEGGVYVFYCLKHAASITFKVFNDKGKQLYQAEPKFKTPGTHQEFYGGVDQNGAPIKPGRYIYRLEAVYDGKSAEWRQADFNLKRKKR